MNSAIPGSLAGPSINTTAEKVLETAAQQDAMEVDPSDGEILAEASSSVRTDSAPDVMDVETSAQVQSDKPETMGSS